MLVITAATSLQVTNYGRFCTRFEYRLCKKSLKTSQEGFFGFFARIRISSIACSIHIFSDSMYSLGCLTKGWQSTDNARLIKAVKIRIRATPHYRTKTCHWHWTPGHAEVEGNTVADGLSNEASAASKHGRGPSSEALSAAIDNLPISCFASAPRWFFFPLILSFSFCLFGFSFFSSSKLFFDWFSKK